MHTTTAHPARPAHPSGHVAPLPAGGTAPFAAERLLTPEVLAWLDEAEAALVHPAVVADRLRRDHGWPPDHAAAVAERYRQRFDEHGLGYFALLCATGLTALGAASAAHVALGAVTGDLDRPALAAWLTLGFSAAPFAVWAHVWAARTDVEDPVAVWSRPRRSFADLLQAMAVIVGTVRLLHYVGSLMFALTGASSMSGRAVAAGAANVAVTCAVALTVGLWARAFAHRFDAEDPTRRPRRTRPTR